MANDVVSKTITGSIANFTTNLTRPLQALKTYFTPNQNGSGDPSPENVRDVVSWNSIDVIKCGKNIIGRSGLEASITKNGITATLRSDGTSYALSGTATARADLYILSYNTNNYAWQPMPYTISVNAGLALNDTGDYLVISIVDSENTIRYITTKSSKQFTIASNEKVRGIFIRVAEGKVLDNVVVTPQIEVGSTASSYEPYGSTTYQYSFSPSDPSLVAGTLNITTGELTVTYKKLVIDGTNLDVSDIWKVNTSSTYNSILYAIDKDLFGNDTPKYINGKAYPMFNWLAEMTTQTLQALWHGYLSSNNGIVMVIPSGTASTEANLKSYLTAHPLEIGYELAEPQTYQLTPQEITALFGVNNIWTSANGGNEVTYLDKEHVDIALSRRRIIMSAPHIESASGSIASFSTDMAANLKECKFAFSPVQDGSGDPAPDNVRPISGWTGMEYIQCAQADNLLAPAAYTTDVNYGGIHIQILENGKHIKLYGTCNTNNALVAGYVHTDEPCYCYGVPISSFPVWKTNDGELYNDINGVELYPDENGRIAFQIQFVSGMQYDFDFYPIFTDKPRTPISWQSEAGTVYGGYVDLVKGEVVAEWLYAYAGWSAFTKFEEYSPEGYLTGSIKLSVAFYGGEYPQYCMCDIARTSVRNDYSSQDAHCFFSRAGDTFLCVLPDNTPSNTGIHFCAKLATPIHTPITPTILKTLKGTNNIWSSGNGNANVSYWTH